MGLRSLVEIQGCTFGSNIFNGEMTKVANSTLKIENSSMINNVCFFKEPVLEAVDSSLSAEQLLLSDNLSYYRVEGSNPVYQGVGLSYNNTTSDIPFGSVTPPFLDLSACTISNNAVFGNGTDNCGGDPGCSGENFYIDGVGAFVRSSSGEFVTINSCSFVGNELAGDFVVNQRTLNARGGGSLHHR